MRIPASGRPSPPRGREVSYAEMRLAAEVSRFPARFGLRVPLNGFLAWRAYTALRGGWRLLRRRGRRR